MRYNHRTTGHHRPRNTRQFFNNVSIRKSMKTIAAYTLPFISPRDRQQLRQGRKGAVKSSIETRDLYQTRIMLSEKPDKLDLSW